MARFAYTTNCPRSRTVAEAYLLRDGRSSGEVCIQFDSNRLYYSYVVTDDAELLDDVEAAIDRSCGFGGLVPRLKQFGENHYREGSLPMPFLNALRSGVDRPLPVGNEGAPFAV